MAKGKRDLRLEKRWRGLVMRQPKSGLGVRGFCLREGIPESSFYALRRELQLRSRVRLAGSGAPGMPAFVPMQVEVRPPLGRDDGIVIELGHGRSLRLPPQMPVDRITELVRAVEAAS